MIQPADRAVERIVATLTPTHLRDIVLEIAASLAPDNRGGVASQSILQALACGCDLGAGSARSAAYRRLKGAVIETIGQTLGMRYVLADD